MTYGRGPLSSRFLVGLAVCTVVSSAACSKRPTASDGGGGSTGTIMIDGGQAGAGGGAGRGAGGATSGGGGAVSADAGACGRAGDACCSDGSCTAPNTLCASATFTCVSCGAPGQPCCSGSACNASGCCLAGRCTGAGEACQAFSVNYGTCTQGACACGKTNQPCCPMNESGFGTCSDGASVMCLYQAASSSYKCFHCGAVSEPCCSSTVCNDSGTACDLGPSPPICRPCGLTGNPCCANGSCSAAGACCSGRDVTSGIGTCVAPGASCKGFNNMASGTCVAGVCHCGSEGEPCCSLPGQQCADANDRCAPIGSAMYNTCVRCGLAGNPCCANNSCASGGCCLYRDALGSICVGVGADCQLSGVSAPGTCASGTCGACGGLSQPCCESVGSNTCTAPNTMCSTLLTAGTCEACGGMGLPCCDGRSVDYGGYSCNAGLTCRPGNTAASTCQP